MHRCGSHRTQLSATTTGNEVGQHSRSLECWNAPVSSLRDISSCNAAKTAPPQKHNKLPHPKCQMQCKVAGGRPHACLLLFWDGEASARFIAKRALDTHDLV